MKYALPAKYLFAICWWMFIKFLSCQIWLDITLFFNITGLNFISFSSRHRETLSNDQLHKTLRERQTDKDRQTEIMKLERDWLTEMSFTRKSRHSLWSLSTLTFMEITTRWAKQLKGKKLFLLPGKLTLRNINQCGG